MDVKEFQLLLDDAEVKLKRLRALYEQWFQGIERIEPQVPRKDFDRTMRRLDRDKPRNTAARFRFQQLRASYTTYATYWQRIARKIEEGTYERDLQRSRRRRQRQVEQEPRPAKTTYELDLDAAEDPQTLFGDDEITGLLDGLEPLKSIPPGPPPRAALSPFTPFASPKGRSPQSPPPKASKATFARPQLTPPPPPPKGPPRPPPPPPRAQAPSPPPPPTRKPPTVERGPDLKRLHRDFVEARRKQNQRADMPLEKLQAKVEKMIPKLREKHGNRPIDFEVVVKDGRVALRPKVG
jgi:hypothetical protein